MHYYKMNIGDYVSHTSYLTPMEDLAYRRLLDRYYLSESPLVNDVKKLARLINLRGEEDAVEQVLEDFFSLTDDGWRNKRADEEIAAFHAKAEAAKENGKKGGRPKKPKADANPKESKAEPSEKPEVTESDSEEKPKKTQSVNLANPEETGSKANHKPLTNNHKPNIKPTHSNAHNAPSIEPEPDTDLRQKFAMHRDWIPDQQLIAGECVRQGVPVELITSEKIAEFTNYFADELKTHTEGQWIGKLLNQVKHSRRANHAANQPQRSSEPRKLSAVERVDANVERRKRERAARQGGYFDGETLDENGQVVRV